MSYDEMEGRWEMPLYLPFLTDFHLVSSADRNRVLPANQSQLEDAPKLGGSRAHLLAVLPRIPDRPVTSSSAAKSPAATGGPRGRHQFP
jgi:hypothetical protein